jgi:hypothetical protein
MDFFRREIPLVNWVRDREDSDVHVLVTTQTTGGGGRAYTLAFIGMDALEGEDQDLLVNTPGDATDDEVRRAIAERLKMGLVRYLAGTSAADQISISIGEEAAGPSGPPGPGMGRRPGQAASQEDDPWDFWVFRIGGNTFLNGESSQKFSNVNTSVSANRTTEAWKFNLSGRYSRRTNSFTFDEEGEEVSVETVREDWSATSLLVKSLTPHWSVGAKAGAGRSTFLNEDFRWNVAPGIEYNVFPYSESSRRSFTFQALLDVRHWDYETETIFLETEETRLAASLTAALNQVQPWGRTNVFLTGSQYVHDRDLHRVSMGGSLEVRLFKGFSVNFFGNYSWIRDQLFLSAEGATTEEILLQQRQLATSFSYFTSVGISYRFGSIFNNVVNPRFGGGGGGGGMMIIG